MQFEECEIEILIKALKKFEGESFRERRIAGDLLANLMRGDDERMRDDLGSLA